MNELLERLKMYEHCLVNGKWILLRLIMVIWLGFI